MLHVTCLLKNVNLLIVKANIFYIFIYNVVLVFGYNFHKVKHNNYNIII